MESEQTNSVQVEYRGDDVVFIEGDEEVMYVVADLGPGAEHEVFTPGTTCEIKALDTDAPEVILNGTSFVGAYEDFLGTLMMFNTNRSSEQVTAKYVCHTTKKINFQRVGPPPQPHQQTPKEQQEPVTKENEKEVENEENVDNVGTVEINEDNEGTVEVNEEQRKVDQDQQPAGDDA